jgi:hypothetical protein
MLGWWVPYMDTQVDRLMREVAVTWQREFLQPRTRRRFFGTPDGGRRPYFGGEGPKRRGASTAATA